MGDLLTQAKDIARERAVRNAPMEPFFSRLYYGLWYIFAPYSYHADWLKRAGR